MGWSSWSFYRDHPTEAIVKAQANALIANGLLTSGYRYVNIDDGWSDGFYDHGIPKPNLSRFPSGMNGMARYMHQHGLLFGLYLNPGISDKLYQQNPIILGTTAHLADITDTSQPGSTRRNSYRIDFAKPAAAAYVRSQVKQFDAWGIDFIKFDFVGPGGGNLPADNREELRQWHAAIARASHPIWLELSNFLSIDQAPLVDGCVVMIENIVRHLNRKNDTDDTPRTRFAARRMRYKGPSSTQSELSSLPICPSSRCSRWRAGSSSRWPGQSYMLFLAR